MKYDYKGIEAKWQKRWDDEKSFRALDDYTMPKYYALVVIQGLIGAGLVQFLPTVLPVSAAVIKIPVDLVLFGISYFIQRDFVFDK